MSGFNNLPAEVLQLICEHAEDVTKFALASKTCLAAASPRLYATVKIMYTIPRHLFSDIERWKAVLKEYRSVQHVRCLELRAVHIPDVHDDNLWNAAERDLSLRHANYGPAVEIPAGSQQDEAWQAVADFVGTLPCLTDVRYACAQLLPASLLDAIEMKRGCRLHLDEFRLLSLLKLPPKPEKTDEYEKRYATSSCLNSVVTTNFEKVDGNGAVSYLADAMKAMTRGLAPNLQSITLHWVAGHNDMRRYQAYQTPVTAWQGTEMGQEAPRDAVGTLRTLELTGPSICALQELKSWSMAADFAKLQYLKIWDQVGIETLRWLTSEIDLSSLRSLSLRIVAQEEQWDRHLQDVDLSSQYSDLNRQLILLTETLPPLCTLHLEGPCEYSVLGHIMQYHGQTLQKLTICPDHWEVLFGDAFIHFDDQEWQIPSLKELTITVLRTDGDQNELRQYEWLGRHFPRLRTLKLLADCRHLGPMLNNELARDGKLRPQNYRFSAVDLWLNQYNNGREVTEVEVDHDPGSYKGKMFDLRYVMRNYAIDGALAEAILHTINSFKATGSSPLESLTLRIRKQRGDMLQYPRDFFDLCTRVLGREWQCTLDLADPERQNVHTEEIVRDHPHGKRDTKALDKGVIKIFHTQWPEQPGEDWRECWHSYPLADRVS